MSFQLHAKANSQLQLQADFQEHSYVPLRLIFGENLLEGKINHGKEILSAFGIVT